MERQFKNFNRCVPAQIYRAFYLYYDVLKCCSIQQYGSKISRWFVCYDLIIKWKIQVKFSIVTLFLVSSFFPCLTILRIFCIQLYIAMEDIILVDKMQVT